MSTLTQNKTTVIIFQVQDGWNLRLTSSEQNVDVLMPFKRLIDALNAACVLKVHVDNADELPIKQYKLGA